MNSYNVSFYRGGVNQAACANTIGDDDGFRVG